MSGYAYCWFFLSMVANKMFPSIASVASLFDLVCLFCISVRVVKIQETSKASKMTVSTKTGQHQHDEGIIYDHAVE